MKYYGEIRVLEIEKINNFPNKFPSFIIFSDVEFRKYKANLASAATKGFNLQKRKLCFTLRCKEGFTHAELQNILDTIPEITQEKYNLLKEIPHWNPFVDANTILEEYLKLWSEMETDDTNLLTQAFKNSEDSREVRISQVE